jgi:hypothetical protein
VSGAAFCPICRTAPCGLGVAALEEKFAKELPAVRAVATGTGEATWESVLLAEDAGLVRRDGFAWDVTRTGGLLLRHVGESADAEGPMPARMTDAEWHEARRRIVVFAWVTNARPRSPVCFGTPKERGVVVFLAWRCLTDARALALSFGDSMIGAILSELGPRDELRQPFGPAAGPAVEYSWHWEARP